MLVPPLVDALGLKALPSGGIPDGPSGGIPDEQVWTSACLERDQAWSSM
jgi:hypothetical protein